MSSSFSFPHPTTTIDDLEDLYKVYGVDLSIVLDLAGASETPETVRGGYCGANLSFFQFYGLTFPIPESVLEILVELDLSFTQFLPNFLRHLIAFLVRAREEGLSFGLGDFRHLVLVKRNKQSPGTFLVSPRPGRHVIEYVPYCDEKWHEQFFVFKVDRASVAPSGSSLMSDEIHGLIGVLRRGRSHWSSFDRTRIRAAFPIPEGTNSAPLVVGGSEDETEHSREVIATPSVQAQSSDRLVRQLVRRSSFRAFGSASRSRASNRPPLVSIQDSYDEGASEERWSPISLSLGSEDEAVAATRKRRRSSKAALPGPSRSRLVSEGDGSLFAAQGKLISLAGRMRSAGCRLPSLVSSDEKEAYAKVAVVSPKVMEAFNEYVMVMEDRVEASRNDKEIESIGS
ncbi:uncharacterized protein LOC106417345 [Brassica napus]|uniref:uncharacterized protein LOC106417345 n=1 Tax=Brassica napus TaxID=3708 RepID=UPI0006AB1384|nr:uncharacterized protein LOC106417345 [Brassica napus]